MLSLKKAQLPLNIYSVGAGLHEQHRTDVIQVLLYVSVNIVLHLSHSLLLIRMDLGKGYGITII